MTLLVTVLLALTGASIAVVILGQSLFTTSSTIVSARSSVVAGELSVARGGFEAALAQNPYFWETTVFADPGDSVAERARVCQGGSVVQPGSAWPAACGTYWTYTASSGSVPERVVVQITAPSLANPNLQVDFLAHSGCPSGVTQSTLSSCAAESGIQVQYRMGDAGTFTVYSTASLDLNSLAPNEPSGGSQSTTLTGTVYSAGTISLGQSGSASLGNVALEAEGGFIGTPSGSTALLAAGGISSCANQPTVSSLGGQSVVNIRCVQPAPLNGSGLVSGVNQAVTAACLSGPGNFVVGTTNYANELCLRQGRSLVTTAGTTVTVPSVVNGYLLIPGGDAGGASPANRTIDIYTYTDATGQSPDGTLPTPVGGCDIRCNLVNLATPAVSSNQHPGTLGYWTLLGTFWLPYNGVISTDADVSYGLCGSNFTTSSACAAPSASVGGFTVVAGTPAQPRNLFIAGSTATYTNNVALEATGDIVFPYWDHAKATSLVSGIFTDQSGVYVDASLVALGGGFGAQSSAIITNPASVPYGVSANQSALLDINGSIEASSVNLGDLGLFANIVFSAPSSDYTTPAPWYTGPTIAWRAGTASPLGVSAYAGLGG